MVGVGLKKSLLLALSINLIDAFPRRSRGAIDSKNGAVDEDRKRIQGYAVREMANALNVLDFGAVPDCTGVFVDNTAAFQAALDAASGGGGGVVFSPPGCYAFDGELILTNGITLSGSWKSVPSHDYKSGDSATDGIGTTFLPRNNRGCAPSSDSGDNGDWCDDPFITLKANSKLEGVVIYYPEQLPTEVPASYPYSVALVGNNAAVTDVELLNSWNGIWAVEAHRHYIARVQGQPTNVGIFVDETYDIGRIEDVHWNPWYSMEEAYFSHQCIYGRGFVLGRSDWEYVFNTFAFGYAIGYHFIATPTGSMNGNFLGIGADLAYNASVRIDASQAPGILITNGEFTAFTNDSPACEGCTSSQVVIGEGNTGPVKFVDSSFWGPASSVAVIKAGSTGTTTFIGCEFVQWDIQGGSSGRAAVYQGGSGTVTISNCGFQEAGNKTHLELAEEATKAIFMGNSLASGNERITDNTDGGATVVGIGLNI